MEVSCYFTAHRFRKGNRIRVAITESLWPLVWPSPRPVRLRITTAESVLSLPVRPPAIADDPPRTAIVRDRLEQLAASGDLPGGRTVTEAGPDGSGRVTIEKSSPADPQTLEDIGTIVSGGRSVHLSIREGDPNSGVWRMEGSRGWRRGAWDTTIHSAFELTSTAEEFRLKESVRALEGDTVVFERQSDDRIKRDLI